MSADALVGCEGLGGLDRAMMVHRVEPAARNRGSL